MVSCGRLLGVGFVEVVGVSDEEALGLYTGMKRSVHTTEIPLPIKIVMHQDCSVWALDTGGYQTLTT